MNSNDGMLKKTDSDRLRQHLEESKTAIEKGFPMDPDKKINILRQRARLLSREAVRIEKKENQIEVVDFILAYENYAIESRYIREVYPLKEFTTIPCTPNFVLGIINVRGRIITIIDLKKFFDLPDKGIADFNKVIIITSEQNEFGVVVDGITGVRSVPASGIQPSLPTLTGVSEEYLKGILEDRTVVLDAATILSDSKIIVHEEVDM